MSGTLQAVDAVSVTSRPRKPAWQDGAGRALVLSLLSASVGLLLPALLLGLWWAASVRRWVPEQILPSPGLVWQSLLELSRSGELLLQLRISAVRVGWSLLIGGGTGLLLGVAMGGSRQLRAYLKPSFDMLAQFPVLAWIPLLIIFVGIDEALKVTAISLAVLVPVTLNSWQGMAQVPRTLFEVGRVHGFGVRQQLGRVVLPAALPSLFSALRQGVMQAWLTLVFVELLSSSEGIGYLMVWGRQLMQMDLVVVGMLVIGAVGVAIEWMLGRIEAHLNRWRVTAC